MEATQVSLERGTRPGGPRTDGPDDPSTRIGMMAVLVGAALVLSIVVAIGALTPGAGTGASPVPSSSVQLTAFPEPSISAEPSVTAGPTASAEPTDPPEPIDTSGPVTPEPSVRPAATPLPTVAPTIRPTPTIQPTATPTIRPTPTPEATPRPTRRPTRTPDLTPAGDDPSDLPRFPGARLEERERGRSGDLTTLKLEYTTPARLDRVRRHYRTMLRRHGWFVGDVEFDHDEWEIEANKGKREVAIELKREGNRTEVDIELSWPSE